MVKAKQFHRHRCFQILRAQKLGLLRAVFEHWQSKRPATCSFAPWLRVCDTQLAWHQHAFAQLAVVVTRESRAEDCIFFEQLAISAGQSAESGLNQVWSHIRALLPKQRKKRQSNLRAIGPDVATQVDHYCALEAGEKVEVSQLLSRCHSVQQQSQADSPLIVPLTQLPTRFTIERLGNAIKSNRAAGLDRIRPETVTRWVQDNARSCSVLMVKAWVLSAEPLQWKGGLLHSIGKKQSPNEHRGIMLMDVLAKLWHSLLRQRFLPTIQTNKQPFQLGGFRGQQTSFVTLYVRLFTQLAAHHVLSSAVLFLDIKSAYHSLIREVLFEARDLPPRLCEVLKAAGIDPALLVPRLEAAHFVNDLSPMDFRVFDDVHQHTWMTLAHHDDIYQVHRGCRPGSPIADACFNALMALALTDIQAFIDQHPIHQAAQHRFPLATPLAAWVDDVSIPLVACSPSALDVLLRDVTLEVDRVFKSFGLTLNMQPRKTSAVVTYRGTSAPAHRHTRQVQELNFFPLCANRQLHISADYEHLGTVFSSNGTIKLEVQHRMNLAKAAHHQVARRIFHNKHLPVHTRLQLLDSLVVSTMIFGAGSWPLLSAQSYASLNHVLIGWQRQIIGDGYWSAGCLSNSELQRKWSLTPLSVRLGKARLLFAFQLMKNAPPLLLQYLTAHDQHFQHGWFFAVRHSLTWLQQIYPEHVIADPTHASVEVLCDWFRDFAHKGPNLVRRAVRRFLHQEHVAHDVQQLHHQLKQTFCSHGALFAPDALTCPSEASLDFECFQCGQSFPNRQRLQVHQWTAHQVISVERQFAITPECQACHRHFWTIARLQQHLRLSRQHPNGCFEQLTWRFPPELVPHHATCPDELQGVHRLPACAAATVPTYEEAVSLRSRDDADQQFRHRWQHEGFPNERDVSFDESILPTIVAILQEWRPGEFVDPQEPIDQICDLLHNQPSEPAQHQAVWSFVHWIFTCFRKSQFPALSEATFSRLFQQMWQLVRHLPLGNLLLWKHRMDNAYCPDLLAADCIADRQTRDREPIHFSLMDQTKLLFPFFAQPIVQMPPPLQVPLVIWKGQPTLLLVHLYSGRRRIGDCHWWVNGLAESKFPAFPILVVSFDTALSATLGNLDRGNTFTRLCEIAQTGAVAGCLTGPPCETFSAARNVQLLHKCPRPLRTRVQPWGLLSLTCREYRQVEMGTRLLFHSWIVEANVALTGGGSIQEHPREPPQADFVSVWRTQVHADWMMRITDAHPHTVQQWQFGAPGVKPTTLRALNLGDPHIVAQALQHYQDPTLVRPNHVLTGKDAKRNYKTSAAKEYPSRLCGALSEAMLAGLTHRGSLYGFRHVALTADNQSWLETVLSTSSSITEGTWLPDYQGAWIYLCKSTQGSTFECRNEKIWCMIWKNIIPSIYVS